MEWINPDLFQIFYAVGLKLVNILQIGSGYLICGFSFWKNLFEKGFIKKYFHLGTIFIFEITMLNFFVLGLKIGDSDLFEDESKTPE